MSSWRPEDESLLTRVRDELLLERVWRWHVGPLADEAQAPHPRAAGMFAALRAMPGADEPSPAAGGEDVQELARALQPKSVQAFPPALHHHLALYFAKVAGALEATSPPSAAHFRTRSLASWLALADERSYLQRLASNIAAGELDDAALARAIAEAPFATIDELGRVAKDGARDLSTRARAALLALGEVAHACGLAGASDATRRTALRRAASRRGAAVDAALTPIADALDDASARGELASRGGDLLRRALDVWRWAAHDEAVEQFAVDRANPIAWDLYRSESWDALRALVGAIEPMVERLAKRIEKDPTHIAYAASCAEVLVFRAQLESPLARQIETAERSLRICPSHRNGRLILASYLCQRANELTTPRSVTGVLLVSAVECAAAEALLERAEKLFPGCTRLPDARERLAKARRR